MVKLGTKDREVFLAVVTKDLAMIDRKFREHVRLAWDRTKDVILDERGWNEIKQEKVALNNEIETINQKIADLDKKIHSEDITIAQKIEFGGENDRYGKDAKFYGIKVKSELDYAIAKRIQENIDVEVTSKRIIDLANSVYRELAMIGTFEDAQVIYTDFYSLDFRKHGVDIPPRLAEFKGAYETILLAEENTPVLLKESEYEKTRKSNSRVKLIEGPKKQKEDYIG